MPHATTHILQEHSDEVWFLAYSHDGKYLATASKDATAIIWNVGNWIPAHILSGHKEPISFLSWSPKDNLILTASNDHSLKIWNVKVLFTSHPALFT